MSELSALARPVRVKLRLYGVENPFVPVDGFLAVHKEDPNERGDYTVGVDQEGWELSTENYQMPALREKITWRPELRLLPYVLYRGGRQLLVPGSVVVTYPGGLRLVMTVAEAQQLYEVEATLPTEENPPMPDDGPARDETGV